MPETVMVTVRFGTKEQDFELPFKRPIGEWEEDVLSAFGAAASGRSILWCFEGRTLSVRDSLSRYGIFDGSILEIGLGMQGGEAG